MQVKLGCMTRPWAGYPLERALEGIARAGFKYTAYVGQHLKKPTYTYDSSEKELNALKAKVDGFGLTSVAAWAGDPLHYGEEGMRKHVAAAAVLGLEYLILSSPYLAEEKRTNPDMTVDDEFAAIVEPVLEEAAAANLELHVKPHMGEFGAGPGLARLAEKIGHPNFGVSYDPGNIHFYEGLRSETDLPFVGKHVKSLCVKDHKGAQREANFPNPGDGDVKWEEVWRLLSEASFNGYAVVELLDGAGDTEVDESAAKVRERLVGWVKGAGGKL